MMGGGAPARHAIGWRRIRRFHRYDYCPCLIMTDKALWVCQAMICLLPGWLQTSTRADDCTLGHRAVRRSASHQERASSAAPA